MVGGFCRFNISIVTLMLCSLAFLSGCNNNDKANGHESHDKGDASIDVPKSVSEQIQIRTEPIEMRTLGEHLHLTGQIHPDTGKESDVAARVTGRVHAVFVRPGDRVVKGQKLALLDSQEISEMEAELLEAVSKVNIAKVHVDREQQVYKENLERPRALIEAKTAYEETKVQLDLAQAEANRVEGLRKERIAAEKDYLSAQANLAKCRLTHKEAVSRLQLEQALYANKAMLRRDLQLAEAESSRERQHLTTLIQRLEFLGLPSEIVKEVIRDGKIGGSIPIRSKVEGVITHMDIAPGEIISPDKVAFTITDLDTVLVSSDLPEVDLRWIRLGTPTVVKVASYPGQEFKGVISYISDTIKEDTRTASIRASLKNPGHRLKVNMFSEMDLQAEPRAVVAVPKSAVQEHEGKKVVYKKDGEKYIEHPVKLGIDTEKYYEVLSGLSPGDLVVTQGSLMLKTELSYRQH